jgi:hypothetical protein
MSPPLHSIILTDAMVIKAAHDYGLWNALRKNYAIHTVPICVEEATRVDSKGRILVRRPYAAIAAEVTIGAVTKAMRTDLTLIVGDQSDLDEGERDLLAYGRTLPIEIWWLCGPDNGTVRAMRTLGVFDKMVSLQSIAVRAGCQIRKLPDNYTEQWLSRHRTRDLLDDLEKRHAI